MENHYVYKHPLIECPKVRNPLFRCGKSCLPQLILNALGMHLEGLWDFGESFGDPQKLVGKFPEI